MPNDTSEKKIDLSPSTAILIGGVLIAAAILFVNYGPQPSQQVVLGDSVTDVAVTEPTSEDHWRGSPDAPIVLVEYSDFQCPYCALIHPTLQRIVDESNGGIAWVYRNLPLESIHPQALPAALAAECISEQLGDAGFWAFADSIFADQSNLGATRFTALATQLGVNQEQFASCVESKKYLNKISASSLEAQQNGGAGTPFTVVVGKDSQVPISGALPYAQIMAVINSVR